jgi:hypothetical protein
MSLLHRHPKSPDEEPAAAAADGDYDAQTDLALPTSESTTGHPDPTVPFGGMLEQQSEHPGYDVERDTAG